MPTSRRAAIPLAVLAGVLLVTFAVAPALGEARSKGELALDKARRQGKELYTKAWKPGAKTCVVCHSRGPNKLRLARVKGYPRYDKVLRKVVTIQQKLNQMITTKSGGKALPLGSPELNALEAYLSTLK